MLQCLIHVYDFVKIQVKFQFILKFPTNFTIVLSEKSQDQYLIVLAENSITILTMRE